MHIWQAQEAQIEFGKLLEASQKEPQLVVRQGQEIAYVISALHYDKLVHNQTSMPVTVGAFFRQSPLYAAGIELDLQRSTLDATHREVNFGDERDS